MTILPQTAAEAPLYAPNLLTTRPFANPAPKRSLVLAWRVSFPRHKAIDLLQKGDSGQQFGVLELQYRPRPRRPRAGWWKTGTGDEAPFENRDRRRWHLGVAGRGDAEPAPEARALRHRAGGVRGARHHRRGRVHGAAIRHADPASRHRRGGIHPGHRRHLQAGHQVRRLARAQRFLLPPVRRHRQADRQPGLLPVLAEGARHG